MAKSRSMITVKESSAIGLISNTELIKSCEGSSRLRGCNPNFQMEHRTTSWRFINQYTWRVTIAYASVVVPVRSRDHPATVVATPKSPCPVSSRESIETMMQQRQLPLLIVLRHVWRSLNKWPAPCAAGSYITLPRGSD